MTCPALSNRSSTLDGAAKKKEVPYPLAPSLKLQFYSRRDKPPGSSSNFPAPPLTSSMLMKLRYRWETRNSFPNTDPIYPMRVLYRLDRGQEYWGFNHLPPTQTACMMRLHAWRGKLRRPGTTLLSPMAIHRVEVSLWKMWTSVPP